MYEQRKRRKYFFIADFYCAEKKTVLELDGKYHEHRKYEDYHRDLVWEGLGLSTLRIKNEELKDIRRVKAKILDYLEK